MTTPPTSPPPLAVVTGASTGIGRALAQELADHGFDLVVAADEPSIREAAAALSASGRTALPVQVDLSTAAGVEELYRQVRETGRTPEAIALNAGIGHDGRFVDIDLADDLSVVDLNVRSTVHLGKLLIRDMVAAGRGRVLITSSIAAVAPGPYQATYAASKAFVHSFAESIREELKDTGVTVTSLMPGPTDTAFFKRNDMEDSPIAQGAQDDSREVAADGYEAMMAGRSSVVAGSVKNRIAAELGTHLPDALATPLLARLTKPKDD